MVLARFIFGRISCLFFSSTLFKTCPTVSPVVIVHTLLGKPSVLDTTHALFRVMPQTLFPAGYTDPGLTSPGGHRATADVSLHSLPETSLSFNPKIHSRQWEEMQDSGHHSQTHKHCSSPGLEHQGEGWHFKQDPEETKTCNETPHPQHSSRRPILKHVNTVS